MAYFTMRRGTVVHMDGRWRMQIDDGSEPAPIVSMERFYGFDTGPGGGDIGIHRDFRPADLPQPGDPVVVIYKNTLVRSGTGEEEEVVTEVLGWGSVKEYDAILESADAVVRVKGFAIVTYVHDAGQTANVRDMSTGQILTGHLRAFDGPELPNPGVPVQFTREVHSAILDYWRVA